MKYSAIIPVRAGSRRLPNKNILPFGGTNLLIHKIRQLKKVEQINEIIVSSDSDVMLEMALKEGVKVHKRPIEYADEKTKTFGEVVAYCAENACHGENVIWAPCVCPLCNEYNFSDAINKYEELVLTQNEYDSVISAKLFKEYLWNEEKPLNYKLGMGHVPSQQLPEYNVIVNGFYIAPRLKMIEWNYFFGLKPYRLIISKKEAIDIDDKEDFEMAKALLDLQEE